MLHQVSNQLVEGVFSFWIGEWLEERMCCCRGERFAETHSELNRCSNGNKHERWISVVNTSTRVPFWSALLIYWTTTFHCLWELFREKLKLNIKWTFFTKRSLKFMAEVPARLKSWLNILITNQSPAICITRKLVRTILM